MLETGRLSHVDSLSMRDSAYLWNEEMDSKLRQIGFHPLEDDPCVYVKGSYHQLHQHARNR
jgi:hypothetical protein